MKTCAGSEYEAPRAQDGNEIQIEGFDVRLGRPPLTRRVAPSNASPLGGIEKALSRARVGRARWLRRAAGADRDRSRALVDRSDPTGASAAMLNRWSRP